jgi:hypothetical protein
MFGIFRKKSKQQLLGDHRIIEIADRFVALEDQAAAKYINDLFDEIGPDSMLRLKDVLNSRLVGQTGGSIADLIHDDGPLITKYEMLMRVLMARGIDPMPMPEAQGVIDGLARDLGAQFAIPPSKALEVLLGFMDYMAMRVSDADKTALLASLPGSLEALERAFDDGIIDGTAGTAIRLVGESGLTVQQAVQFQAQLYREIEENAETAGLVPRIREQLDGQLPPFF